jgi:GNAT superfamily N-acetyltransferase
MKFTGDIREFDDIWDVLQEEVNLPDGVEFDPEHVRERGQWLIDGEESDILVVYKYEEIIGFMGIVAYSNPFSGEQWAMEHMFYILPEHRGFPAIALVSEAKRWAKEHGCTNLVLSANTFISKGHELVCSLYEKLGMQKFETSYIERID